jgi:Tfp pilus assembly protein PilF
MAAASAQEPRTSFDIHRLRRFSLLMTLSDEALAQVAPHLQRRQYSSGETIIRYGVRGGFLGIVEAGELAVISRTPGGRTFVAPLRSGEFFALTDGARSSAAIRAVTDATLWMLNQAALFDLGSSSASISPATVQTTQKQDFVRTKSQHHWLFCSVLVLLIVALTSVVWSSSPGQHFRADVLYAQGVRYLERQQLNAAKQQFEAALAVNSRHAASYTGLGYVLDQEGRGEDAWRAFERALNLDAESDVAQNNLGVVQMYFGANDVALENLQRAAELSFNVPSIYVNLGNLSLSLGDWINAGRAYREALRLNPRLAVTHYNLGFVYYRQQQYPDASREFKRALAFDPNLAAAYLGLGVINFEQGNLEAARVAFQRASELDPQDAVACFYLGLTHKLMGEYAEAAAAFERVLDLTSTSLIYEQTELHLKGFERLP